MVFAWFREKFLKSNKTLTINLVTMRPTTSRTQFITEFITTSMSSQWYSNTLIDDDHMNIFPAKPTTMISTTPIPTKMTTDMHHSFNSYADLMQIWSTFVMEFTKKYQQDFRFILLCCLIFLCISTIIIFIAIKLFASSSTNCLFKNRRCWYEKIHQYNNHNKTNEKMIEINHSCAKSDYDGHEYAKINKDTALVPNHDSIIELHSDMH